MSYFLVGSVAEHFFGKSFFIYVHLSYNYYEIGFGNKGLLVVYGLGYCLCYF